MRMNEIRVAVPGDAEAVVELLTTSAGAVRDKGIDLWGSSFAEMPGEIEAGRVHVVDIPGEGVVGTYNLRWSDTVLWGPDDGDAGYVHRLARRPGLAGGIGDRLLLHAAATVAAHGRRWLRLDCMRDNASLRAYYEARGFQHVRDVTDVPRKTKPGFRNASLYQRVV